MLSVGPKRLGYQWMVFCTAFSTTVSEDESIEDECLLAHPTLDVMDHPMYPLARLDLSECPHHISMDTLQSYGSTAGTRRILSTKDSPSSSQRNTAWKYDLSKMDSVEEERTNKINRTYAIKIGETQTRSEMIETWPVKEKDIFFRWIYPNGDAPCVFSSYSVLSVCACTCTGQPWATITPVLSHRNDLHTCQISIDFERLTPSLWNSSIEDEKILSPPDRTVEEPSKSDISDVNCQIIQ